MKPTPEDHALAKRIDERMGCLDIDLAAKLIAEHCAELRELAEIGGLAVEMQECWQRYGPQSAAEAKLMKAVKAYIAKAGKEPTP